MNSFFEPITGRYLQISLLGQRHRVYVEEAGQGIPLLCLHTAGADSRQYRAVLNDPEVLRNFRVIAFDLPWHGKSSPPAGWQDVEYRLTANDYVSIIMDVVQAMQLDQPAVMGCSIGGRVILHLAQHHPECFRAIIGLQSGAHAGTYFDSDWLHRPDVHGGEVCAGVVSGLIAPMSHDEHRWETLWHYMQGGPGVFKGDLHFYRVDGDLRGQVSEINTDLCPLYFLTGEYDYSCTPADTLELAEQIKGSTVSIMDKLGHFPMSENPEQFLTYLRPILGQIQKAS